MDRLLRVLHVVDKLGVSGSSVHGVSRLFSWWMPRFDTERYQVSLVVLRQEDVSTRELRSKGIEVEALGKGKFDFSTVAKIVQLARARNIDVLHLHGYGACNFGRMAALVLRIPCIVHEHFVDPNYPVYQKPLDCLLRGVAKHNIAVSESTLKFMIERRCLPQDTISLIYNGAPLAEFKPVADELVVAERRKWNIPDNHVVIGTIGRLDEQKGNCYFIDAARQIADQHENVSFMIVGDGGYLDRLQRQCRELGLEDRMIFTGYHSDTRPLQTLLDIQVFPSLWEGTPLTVFEAMSMGKAIVATNVDGLGEIMTDGETALLVPPADAAALKAAITRLMDDAMLRRRLSLSAARHGVQYDIETAVRKMEAIYDRIAGG